MTNKLSHLLRFLLLWCLLQNSSTEAYGESIVRSRELGHGFRRVTLALPVNADFEGTGYFEFLYYNNERLAQIGGPSGNCSVSPSGCFLAFQDGPSGKVMLYSRGDGCFHQLTTRFVGVVKCFEWRECSKEVEVRFESGIVENYSIPLLENNCEIKSRSHGKAE